MGEARLSSYLGFSEATMAARIVSDGKFAVRIRLTCASDALLNLPEEAEELELQALAVSRSSAWPTPLTLGLAARLASGGDFAARTRLMCASHAALVLGLRAAEERDERVAVVDVVEPRSRSSISSTS